MTYKKLTFTEFEALIDVPSTPPLMMLDEAGRTVVFDVVRIREAYDLVEALAKARPEDLPALAVKAQEWQVKHNT